MSKNNAIENATIEPVIIRASTGRTGNSQVNKTVTCFGVSKHPKESIGVNGGYETRYSCKESASYRADALRGSQSNHTEIALYTLSRPVTQLVAAMAMLRLKATLDERDMTVNHWAAIDKFVNKYSASERDLATKEGADITLSA